MNRKTTVARAVLPVVHRARPPIIVAGLLFTLLLVLAGALFVLQTRRIALDGIARLDQLSAVAAQAEQTGHVDSTALSAARTDAETARRDFAIIDRRIGWIAATPLARLAGHRYVFALHAVRAAEASAAAAATLAAVAEPLLSPGHATMATATAPTSLAAIARNAVPALRQAQSDLATAVEEADAAQVRPSDGAAGRRLQKVAGQLSAAREALTFAIALPGLLGFDGETHLLILYQNPDELRPSGGFLGTATLLTLQGGRIASAYTTHINNFDNPAEPLLIGPAPLMRYMHLHSWNLRDADWWPDFPSSARVIEQFIRIDRNVDLTGVVVLDPATAGAVLDALGGVDLPAYHVHVDSANLLALTNQYTHIDVDPTEYKRFMVALASATMSRLQAASVAQLRRIASDLVTALDSRHVSVYLHPYQSLLDLQQVLARRHWDGALVQGTADYRLVVDANVGYNKLSGVVGERMADTVTVQPDGSADVTTTLRYAYPTLPATERWRVALDDHFRDYIRLYVPAGSLLQGTTGLRDSNQPYEESGKSVFSGFIDLLPGASQSVSFTYRVPHACIGSRYELYVQRQNRDLPLHDHVIVRDAGSVLSDSTLLLDTDRQLRIDVPGVTAPARPTTAATPAPASASFLGTLDRLRYVPPPVSGLAIPSLGVRATVEPATVASSDVATASTVTLAPGSGNPADPGVIAVTGGALGVHQPFARLAEIKAGAEVDLSTAGGHYTYRAVAIERQAPDVIPALPPSAHALYLLTSPVPGSGGSVVRIRCDYQAFRPS